MARARRGARTPRRHPRRPRGRALWEKVEVALNRGFRPGCLRTLGVRPDARDDLLEEQLQGKPGSAIAS